MKLQLWVIPFSAVLSCSGALVAVIVKAWSASAPPEGPARDVEALAPVFLVSAAHMLLLYVLLFSQSSTAFKEHAKAKKEAKAKGGKIPSFVDVKYGGRAYSGVLAADRAVGNLLEQSLPFVLSLYIHAAVVSASGAAFVGWCWLATRALYVLVFTKPFPWIFLSTIPSYWCITYLFGSALLNL